ncbi:hypothetical protein JB92DRAFT_2832455 [Gautieria morchelliformis]|nr:hypothetical protein JB92DRAFT_2832455 [Gautieria morchelliformis]
MGGSVSVQARTAALPWATTREPIARLAARLPAGADHARAYRSAGGCGGGHGHAQACRLAGPPARFLVVAAVLLGAGGESVVVAAGGYAVAAVVAAVAAQLDAWCRRLPAPLS